MLSDFIKDPPHNQPAAISKFTHPVSKYVPGMFPSSAGKSQNVAIACNHCTLKRCKRLRTVKNLESNGR